MMDYLSVARQYVSDGLSPIPLSPDGSKTPKGDVLPHIPDPKTGNKSPSWKPFQTKRACDVELVAMFSNGAIIGTACGEASGNLTVIDFDAKGYFRRWREALPAELFASLVISKTPSGMYHAWYRTAERAVGNRVLARTDRGAVAIETRGHGGYVACPPSPGYTWLQGDAGSIPTISDEDAELLLDTAYELHDGVRQVHDPGIGNPSISRPGDKYAKQHSWAELLETAGWVECGRSGENTYWRRPGKGRGKSASTNGEDGHFYCFTSNAHPFEPGHAYTKFSFYATLHHNGNFNAAARQLATEGFGARDTNTTSHATHVSHSPATLTAHTFSNEDFEPVALEYIWNPRLPLKKQVLVDADGGTNKTCLLAAIAAGFSRGRLPNNEGKCDIIRTAYFHKGEDSSEEIATVFHANGGNFDHIGFFDAPTLNLDSVGLETIRRTIAEGSYKFVVFDALIYFCSHLRAEGWRDPQAVLPALQGLAAICESEDCNIANIRHTTKGTLGKAASELGFGSVQFRNSHRGQMVMRYSPADTNLIIVTDEKGSLLAPRAEAFAFRRKGNQIEYVEEFDNPFDPKDTFAERQSLRTLTQTWLRKLLASGPRTRAEIMGLASMQGISTRTLHRAFTDLGGVSSGRSDAGALWSMPEKPSGNWWTKEDDDPFA